MAKNTITEIVLSKHRLESEKLKYSYKLQNKTIGHSMWLAVFGFSILIIMLLMGYR